MPLQSKKTVAAKTGQEAVADIFEQCYGRLQRTDTRKRVTHGGCRARASDKTSDTMRFNAFEGR